MRLGPTNHVRTEKGGLMNSAAHAANYHVRFTLRQRYLHAILFTTFLGLALTGMPLRFSGAA